MAIPTREAVYKSMKRLFKSYVRDCRRHNVFWEIPLELFHQLTSSKCTYCERPPSQVRSNYTYNGLDRTNPLKGYTPDNVVPCCKECNFIKGNRLTFDEMKAVGLALTTHRRRHPKP